MKKLLISLALIVVLILAASLYWNIQTQPAAPADKSTKLFVIRKGESVREIGNSLRRESLIRDPVAFFIYVKANNMDRNIQAGDYKLSASMSLAAIVEELNHGIVDVWVTFPEGIRAEEVADILSKNVPSYSDSWRAELAKNEGYLFPDTYLLPRDADAALVISILRGNFFKKVAPLGLSLNDPKLARFVTVASLVEREAKHPEDRPLVSSVINNRLGIGMKLDIDATIQYALGYQEEEARWWKKALTAQDLKLDSPYNTYLNNGLPPTPISNPGISSIEAAMNPADTDYLYYVSDALGKNHYASTISEHNANIKKYLE